MHPSPLDPGDLAALPKVELHVHLEGSIGPQTAIDLTRRHGEEPHVELPLINGTYPTRYPDFMDFVELYLAVTRQVRTPDDLTTVAAAFARNQAAQNVRYTEATFTALTFVRNGWAPSDIWRALNDGFAEHPETTIRLIIDSVRDAGANHGHATVALVREGLAKHFAPVAAFGLAGDERGVPASEFTMLRTAADDLGLGLAVHAGETGPASNVRDALDVLRADRIGHGVRAIDDPALLERLVDEQVVLEVCPSSNVVLRVAESLETHPLPELLRRGVAVTINSDDPPFFSTSLTQELEHAVRLANLTRGDLAVLQRRAARAGFMPTADADRIVAEIDAWERAT